MIRPILLCQGFHRAFIDPASPLFSEAASKRRVTCEELVRHARGSGWTVVHSFLDTESVRMAGASSEHRSPRPRATGRHARREWRRNAATPKTM